MSAQKIFKLFGSVARQTGQTLDSIGLKIQGQYGYKEGGETQTVTLFLLLWVQITKDVSIHELLRMDCTSGKTF